MAYLRTALIVGTMVLAATFPSSAQEDHTNHGAPAPTGDPSVVAQLPEICSTGQAAAPSMSMEHDMSPAQADLMAGMDENNRLMMSAGMVEDIDVAFVCAMIPHHQSAINMAKAELEHGDDEWANTMAQTIIDAQEAEIAEMLAWLEAEGGQE